MSEAMIHALKADRAGDLYGRLIGVWDVTNRYFDEATDRWHNGTVVWTAGWATSRTTTADRGGWIRRCWPGGVRK